PPATCTKQLIRQRKPTKSPRSTTDRGPPTPSLPCATDTSAPAVPPRRWIQVGCPKGGPWGKKPLRDEGRDDGLNQMRLWLGERVLQRGRQLLGGGRAYRRHSHSFRNGNEIQV